MDYANIKIFSVSYLLISVSHDQTEAEQCISSGAWWGRVRHHQEGRGTNGMGFTRKGAARGWEKSWAALAQLCHLHPDWKLHGRHKRQRMPNPAETRTILFLSKSSSSRAKLRFEKAVVLQICVKCTLRCKILAAFVMGTANCTALLLTCRCGGGGSVPAPAKAGSTRGGGTLLLSLLPGSQNWRADTDKSLFTVNQDKQDAPLCPQMSQIKHKVNWGYTLFLAIST